MASEKTKSGDVEPQARFPITNNGSGEVEQKEAKEANDDHIIESGVHEHVCIRSLHTPKPPSLSSLASNP